MTKEQKLYLIEQMDKVDDIGEISDGYHTFNSLYNQRLYLFAALVNTYSKKAWKTKRHEDGEPCFGGGWFLVGIDTPEGTYSYHYELKDWNLFKCEELDTAPPFDGHTDKDVARVLSLHHRKRYFSSEAKYKKRDRWYKQFWNGYKVKVDVSKVKDE